MLKRQVAIPQKQQHRHLMKKFSTTVIYEAKNAYKWRKIKENRKFLFRDILLSLLVFAQAGIRRCFPFGARRAVHFPVSCIFDESAAQLTPLILLVLSDMVILLLPF